MTFTMLNKVYDMFLKRTPKIKRRLVHDKFYLCVCLVKEMDFGTDSYFFLLKYIVTNFHCFQVFLFFYKIYLR